MAQEPTGAPPGVGGPTPPPPPGGPTPPPPPPPPAGPAGPVDKASGMSIAALVLGILGVVFCWCGGGNIVLSLPALIIGAIDLKNISAGTSSAKGRGFSIAGVVLGIIGVLICLGWLVYYVIFGAAIWQGIQQSGGSSF